MTVYKEKDFLDKKATCPKSLGSKLQTGNGCFSTILTTFSIMLSDPESILLISQLKNEITCLPAESTDNCKRLRYELYVFGMVRTQHAGLCALLRSLAVIEERGRIEVF